MWHHRTHRLALCDMRTIKKQRASALIPHTKVRNAIPWQDVKTAANMYRRCRDCIVDNVAFAHENTKETLEAIKNGSLTGSNNGVKTTERGWVGGGGDKQNIIINISRQLPKQRNKNNKQKALIWKYFLHGSTSLSSKPPKNQQNKTKNRNLKKKEISQHVRPEHIRLCNLFLLVFRGLVYYVQWNSGLRNSLY